MSASIPQKPMKTQLLLGFGGLLLISLKKIPGKKLSTDCSEFGDDLYSQGFYSQTSSPCINSESCMNAHDFG